MLIQDTQGEWPAFHLAIDKETIEMARRIQKAANVLKEDEGGNGEITFKLKVSGGRISNLLNYAATWFSPGNKKQNLPTSTLRGKRAKSK